MKNLMNCAKKAIICAVMAFLFNSVVPASAAIDPGTGMDIIQIIVGAVQSLGDNPSSAEKEEIRDMVYTLFRSSPDSMDSVWVEADQLHDLYLELCQLGFPCKISYDYDLGRYVIEGTGYVCIPNSFLWVDDFVNLDGRIFTNPDGLAYSAYDPTSSNQLLLNIYGDFGSYIDGIEESLDLVYYRLTKIYDFLTGYTDAAGNQPGTNLYDKLDELVTAIEGVSGGSSVNFDTQPIVDKLQDVVDALDSTPVTSKLGEVITAIDGISFDTLPIVTELQNIFRRLMAVDFATNERVDALLAEIEKISTYADLHEIVTVTPGVLGDVEVVTSGGWEYSDLQFFYNPEMVFVGDGSPMWSVAAGNLSIDGEGAAQIEHCVWDFNTWSSLDLQITASDRLTAASGAPAFSLEFLDSSFNLVQTVTLEELQAGPACIPVGDLGIFMIHIKFPSDAYWYLDNFGGSGEDILQFKYGNKEYPVSESLSFTADGVPHTLYWSNEYNFGDGVVLPWRTIQYEDGHWYLEDSTALTYYDAYLTDALTSAPTTTTTIEGETYTWFEWFYTSYGKGGSGGASDLTPVVMRLDTIIENLNATVGVAGCNHTYRDELDQEPTCILPGLMNHICSQCGSCYSEIVPSLGHDWQYKGYVNEELNMDGEIVKEAHHLFECSRCGEIFYDHDNAGDPETVPAAPAKESDSLSSIIARLFEKLGNVAGELLSGIIKLLDKLLTGFDDVVTGFNEKAEQIATVGGDYPQWLSGVWGIIPADLQLVLTFCVIAMCVAVIGKKIFFVS